MDEQLWQHGNAYVEFAHGSPLHFLTRLRHVRHRFGAMAFAVMLVDIAGVRKVKPWACSLAFLLFSFYFMLSARPRMVRLVTAFSDSEPQIQRPGCDSGGSALRFFESRARSPALRPLGSSHWEAKLRLEHRAIGQAFAMQPRMFTASGWTRQTILAYGRPYIPAGFS